MTSWKPFSLGLCLCLMRVGLAQAASASSPATRSADQLTGESVDLLISRYLSGVAGSDEEALLPIMQFNTAEDRKAFVESLRLAKRAGLADSWWDRSKRSYQVSLRHRSQHITVLYLIPTKEGYLPKTFTVVEVDGLPKIKYTDESAGAREKSVVQRAADQMRKAIQSWRDAEGDALKEKAVEFKEGLRDHIAALSMAKEKGLRLVAGSGTIEEVRQAYDSVKSLSDTELKTLMIGKLEKELARLVASTQPS